MPCKATREISHDPTVAWIVELENGKTIGALDMQWRFHALAAQISAGAQRRDRLAARELEFHARCFAQQTRSAHRRRRLDHEEMAAPELCRKRKTSSWDDPWLQSLDLEYHNIDPATGLFFRLNAAKAHRRMERTCPRERRELITPPANSARAGRAQAVAAFRSADHPLRDQLGFDRLRTVSDFLVMGDPFNDLYRAR